MTILERVESTKRLWHLLLPLCPPPDDYQLGRWISRFDDKELEYAIVRTAQKFRKGLPPDPVIVGRYCTGVLTNERGARLAEGTGNETA